MRIGLFSPHPHRLPVCEDEFAARCFRYHHANGQDSKDRFEASALRSTFSLERLPVGHVADDDDRAPGLLALSSELYVDVTTCLVEKGRVGPAGLRRIPEQPLRDVDAARTAL